MSIYLLVLLPFLFLANKGYTCLGQLLEKDSIVFNYSAVTIDNYTILKKVNVDPTTNSCPSYCDQDGYLHPAETCKQRQYCCYINRDSGLICCDDKDLAIDKDVNDNYNCNIKDTQSVSTATKNNDWKNFQVPAPFKQYCPSHCDENGVQQKAYNCLTPPYCCGRENGELYCCFNSSKSIDDSIKDGYNCNSMEYWQIVLAVCVPLATISLIAFLTMTSYLMCRKRKERQSRCRQRAASGSDISCSSWSESTVSPSNTIRGNPCRSPGCASGHNCSRRQRPLEIFVLGPSIPPPYVDKPPPYSAVCNNGEPNAGYDTTDLDSLPDYESLGLNPMALLQSNVLSIPGLHLNESMDNSNCELNDNNMNSDTAQQSVESVNELSVNSQTVPSVTVGTMLHVETETGDSNTVENGVNIIINPGNSGADATAQADCRLVVQFHNSTQHSDS